MAETTRREIIKVEDLHKSFGKLQVLKGISTSFYEGETVVIIGASGGGKSTFLRCLNRLENPEQGHIWFSSAADSGSAVDLVDPKLNIAKYRIA